MNLTPCPPLLIKSGEGERNLRRFYPFTFPSPFRRGDRGNVINFEKSPQPLRGFPPFDKGGLRLVSPVLPPLLKGGGGASRRGDSVK